MLLMPSFFLSISPLVRQVIIIRGPINYLLSSTRIINNYCCSAHLQTIRSSSTNLIGVKGTNRRYFASTTTTTRSSSVNESSESVVQHPQRNQRESPERLEKSNRLATSINAVKRRAQIRNLLIHLSEMNPKLEAILKPLRDSVKEQGDLVRSLKEQKAPDLDVKKAVTELKARKKLLEDKELSLLPKDSWVDRGRLEDVLKRRFFIEQSFSIYGGVSGLYDYGPPGKALKKNILQEWDSHFVLEEDLHEIEATELTLEPVLKASGHVERFADLMVKDLKTGDCYRLDHLIKSHLEKLASAKDCTSDRKDEMDKIIAQLDGYTKEEMSEVLRKFDMKAPGTGNDLGEPIEFNLMFSTTIGPTGLVKSFLRPETAQGIFVNFKRLLESNQGRLPFGAAQIGKAFRNEISPRSGIIRLREFTMAEIEYFVDPQDKSHPKYDSVKHEQLNLYSACNQMNGESYKCITLAEAVESGTIANQVLAYFISRINSFMLKIGIDPDKIRFRQHMSNEMAHYACDCWDCECLTSYGWVECVGCADRSCYDLTQHTKATGVKLTARRPLKEPKQVELVECIPQKAVLGKEHKHDFKVIADALSQANEQQISVWQEQLSNGFFTLSIQDKDYKITKEMFSVKREKKIVQVEEVIPSVIEPSFGIDRIMYAVLEHNYSIRENDQMRSYFSIPAIVAPIKCSVLPLSNNEEFQPFTEQLLKELKRERVRPTYDASSESIGKRYARTDEIGVAFAITVDFDTLKDQTVTLRNRDSTEQIRVSFNEVVPLVRDLTTGAKTWAHAQKLWPLFLVQKGDGAN